MQVKCKCCGEMFDTFANRKNQKYCSTKDCQRERGREYARKQKLVLALQRCEQCEKEFRPKKKTQYCCSDQCSQARAYSLNGQIYHPNYVKKNREKNRLYHKEHKLRTLYGLSIEQVILMHEQQSKKCLICHREIVLDGKTELRACVDHDHITGKIRGLLCRGCNRFIGYYQDDLDIFRRIISYLEK